MGFDQIVAGPQLIGAIFLIAGWLMMIYPPKEINAMYGYRTALSMKNQQNWDEGNRFSARLMVKYGAVLVLIGLILGIGYSTKIIPLSAQGAFMIVSIIGLPVLAAIMLIVTTQKHIKRKFPQQD